MDYIKPTSENLDSEHICCPFTAKYVPLIEACVRQRGIPFQSVLLDSRERPRPIRGRRTISSSRTWTTGTFSPP